LNLKNTGFINGVYLLCVKTSLNQEKSEFEKNVEKHELEMIARRQELRQMQEDIERQKVIIQIIIRIAKDYYQGGQGREGSSVALILKNPLFNT